MFGINTSMSAFGISRPVRQVTNDQRQLQQQNNVPATTAGEQHDLQDRVLNAAIGYEQGMSTPYIADRQRAMRVLTRKGRILDGNPYRLPGVTDNAKREMQRTKDDFEVVYHSEALDPIREEHAVQSTRATPYVNEEALAKLVAGPLFDEVPDTITNEPEVESSRPVPYINKEALAKLEANQVFSPREDWEVIDDAEVQPASRFSPYDSDEAPKKPSFLRSLSKRVKGSLKRQRAPRRPEISAPLRDLRHEPDGQAEIPDMMEHAVPVAKPAAELANRASNVEEAIKMRRLDAAGRESRRVKGEKKQLRHPEAPNPAPSRPELPKRRKVTVVGSPNRMTDLGDFMNLPDADSSPSEAIEDKFVNEEAVEEVDSYDGERAILKVSSWLEGSQPSGSSTRPDAPTQAVDPTETSQHHQGISAEDLSMDALFDEINQHIAELSLSQPAPSEASSEDIGLQRISGLASYGSDHDNEENQDSEDDDDDERSIMVDTYIEGGHTVWRATERVGENTTRTTEQRIPAPDEYQQRGDDAKASLMLKWLETLAKTSVMSFLPD